MQTQPFFSLELNDVEYDVNLGWSKEERSEPQTISVKIKFQASNPPKACSTDLLSDTICYDNLAQKINHICTKQEYKLIEKLAYDIYLFIKELTEHHIYLKLTKKTLPIAQKSQGASFVICDYK